MEKLKGRVAMVTGASAGIGAAICEALVKSGMKVVGAARRVEKVEELSKKLKDEEGELLAVKCDVTKDEEVYALFDTIKTNFGGVDICVNNAGMSTKSSLLDGTPEEWRYMNDVNVIALCLCTKLAVASMRERGVDDGHIVNISSDSAYTVCNIPSIHFYTGTKFAARAITEGIRQELRQAKSHIRVSAVSPGFVKTEIIDHLFSDFELYKKIDDPNYFLSPSDIAATVLHVISAPGHVEINDAIVIPIDQMEIL